MPIDWCDHSYLRQGTERQRAVYRALQTPGVFTVLSDYTPVLVGTIPLDIDVEASDLDIICEVHDLILFERLVTRSFGDLEGFRVARKSIAGIQSLVANFNHGGFPVEIFGQARPVTGQNAYRHMLAEARLLAFWGEEARPAIRRLKRSGLKTEPAFVRYFNLVGDPYQVLLELALLSDEELRTVAGGSRDSGSFFVREAVP
ncbi:MAG TPA: DUF4269 domain-containing protein [Chloroflexi bacterium]|nr:DUF4269 domain-containing protein [Chloroflexota bacterium]